MVFAADYVGYGTNLLYYLRYEDTFHTFGTISTDTSNGGFIRTASWSDIDARMGHTATLLPNGKVFIAGGSDDVFAELYNPEDHTFTQSTDNMDQRYFHTATLLPNGKVLLAGGGVTQATIYDPYDAFNGGFTEAASMNANKSSFSAQLLPNGNVLLTGGSVDGNQPTTFSVYIYNSSTGSFTEIGNMNSERIGHQATLQSDGKILITGGQMYEEGVYSTLYSSAASLSRTSATRGSSSVPALISRNLL